MIMGKSYKLQLERSRLDLERRGGLELARKSDLYFIRRLIIDSLLGRDLSIWLGVYEIHRDAPLPSHTALILPQIYLLRAGAGWLLNQSVEDIITDGWNTVETAWSAAGFDERFRRVVSSAALGLALARGEQEEINYWRTIRQYYPPNNAMTDVELILGSEAIITPDIFFLVGWQNVSLLDESIANAITALHVQANILGESLPKLLSEGCNRIEEEYWLKDPYSPPRANFEELEWYLSETVVSSFLALSGRGGRIYNPAPLLEPILSIAQPLEEILTGNMSNSTREQVYDDAVPAALADPDLPLRVTVGIDDSIHNELDITEEDLAPFRQRLIASVKWMQQRHDNFAGEVIMTDI